MNTILRETQAATTNADAPPACGIQRCPNGARFVIGSKQICLEHAQPVLGSASQLGLDAFTSSRLSASAPLP